MAAGHATAPNGGDTDRSEIAGIYERLYCEYPSPVVALNRAGAVAMADGPAEGLILVDGFQAEGAIYDYYPLPATRTALLRRLGRRTRSPRV